ncbi:hypothetical protein B4U79_10328 [Dinothrombium tinctorium]|uniref:BHLH domain-containing protein n=1 Tax=Dinothrombium tinctorium TaxID=1965070 RepID=A0A443R073_9ACAR|nr:hypothetical protein B4U79_04078 [Dinothrombium tinctorium]RWS08913.1 hypothetical protein B4U79_10328 [Dinothrombium tinctorium]
MSDVRLPSINFFIPKQFIKQEESNIPLNLLLEGTLDDCPQQEPFDYSLSDFNIANSLCSSLSPVSEFCHDENSSEKTISEEPTTTTTPRNRRWKKYADKKNMSPDEVERKRNLANKQERKRMHRLNTALERLRQAIPPSFQLSHPPRRLSKIKTLRLAIAYIMHLKQELSGHGAKMSLNTVSGCKQECVAFCSFASKN